MKTFQVIRRPLVTEKGTVAQQVNQYYFEVEKGATKSEVKDAIQSIFKVKVIDVRTMNVPGKYKRVGKNSGRTSAWKKAVVTLKEGDRIEFLEGA